MMRNVLTCLALVFSVSLAFAQLQPAAESSTATKPTVPLKPVIFVPAGATLLTELQLTKDDLLPVVAQVFGYFSLQHSGGQVIQGEQLRDLITGMESLWLVEYDFRQKGATPADLIQMNQSLLEAQGWRRIFWNRSSDGKRETMVMVEPPRKGLFVFTARLNANSESIRVVAIRTQGEIDVGTTLWLLTTFLMRPEAPAPTPATTTPQSSSEKAPSVKPTPEKPAPEKSPDQEKESQDDESSKSKDKKSDESKTQEGTTR
ncbi:MAG: hypothetical protein YYHSYBAR_002373 [Candidatus Fervidibacter sacchari]